MTDLLQNSENEFFKNRYQKGRAYFAELYRNGLTPACSPGWISGGCRSGHQFIKNVVCGKEYCPDCGRDGSPIHSTRIKRWTPKQRQLERFGYMVITIPEGLREIFKLPAALADFRRDVKNKLKKMGFSRGLMRWHFFGDCPECYGAGCRRCAKTGAGTKYNPHLNIILEAGYINPETLEEIKKYLQRYFHRHFRRLITRTGIVDLTANVHYQYVKEETKQIHAIKYVTRSTFKLFNKKLAESLKGFMTTTTFGKFKPGNYTEDEKIDNNVCPKCSNNEKVHWIALIKHSEVNGKFQTLDNGTYYKQPELNTDSRSTDGPNKQGNILFMSVDFRAGKKSTRKNTGAAFPVNRNINYSNPAPTKLVAENREKEVSGLCPF